VVVIRYIGSPKATGGTITQVGGYTIHTFTSSGTFAVNNSANSLPVAVNDNISAIAGAARVFDPRENDSDTNGDGLIVARVGPAAHGTVAINPAGDRITYTPTAGYTGSDSFSYTISDGAASATAIVNAEVAVGPSIEYLIVGGGGGGARQIIYLAGGGGGGGVLTGALALPAETSVVVGAGGSGAVDYVAPTNGGDSAFGGLTAVGGGAGGQRAGAGGAGGSGGGGSGVTNAGGDGGAGVPGQGNAGGRAAGLAGAFAAGGGGGASTGGGGVLSSSQSGFGGAGLTSSIDGTARVYGSGGGGGGASGGTAAGIGGVNAGNGSATDNGGSGVANRGGGGYSSGGGGNGGTGVVILRYPTGTFTASGGSVTTVGPNTIHTFTTGGSFTATPTNAPPHAVDDTPPAGLWNTNLDVNVLANDTDAEDGTPVLVSVGSATYGTTSIVAGQARYQPPTNFTGTDSFTYVIRDSQNATDFAKVNVTITAPPSDLEPGGQERQRPALPRQPYLECRQRGGCPPPRARPSATQAASTISKSP